MLTQDHSGYSTPMLRRALGIALQGQNLSSGAVANLWFAAPYVLTLVIMLRISWQVTLLSLLLMPLFVLPARWIGRTMARLSREAAVHNATMNT